MQYLSSYYWQQEDYAQNSLVLQQLVYGKEKIPVLFACICGGETGSGQTYNQYFAEQLTEWFRSRLHRLGAGVRAGNADKLLAETERALCKRLKRIDREIGMQRHRMEKATERGNEQAKHQPQVAGILCVGNCFWVFARGHMHVWLLNMRFERGHCTELCVDRQEEQEDWRLLSGGMEKDIALVLATQDFAKCVTEEEIKECLLVKELKMPEQCRRRLAELGTVAVARGGHRMGAILLVTR